jgi:sigma-B regulation protein RsbU (phosphoserine phosphatase)
MDQHRLYRTIRELGDRTFRSEEQLLSFVLDNIITNEEIPIRGARIWKLEPLAGTYRILKQYGEMEPIARSFRLKAEEYPPFLQLARKGTIFGTEINKYLQRHGIKLYSATGVGEKVPFRTHQLYQYVIGINAEYMQDDMRYALNIIGHALTQALRNRRIESKAKLLEADIDRAREIQKSILPAHEMKFGNYDIYGVSLPERVVGGDFFDYLHAKGDAERLGVVIGDAANKGFSAAAQALYASGALRMGVEFQSKISTLVSRLNHLVHQTFSPEQFISMVYLELVNTERGLTLYVNAGHSSPLLLHAGSGEVETLPATGQIVGPFPGESYRYDFTLIGKGDVLVLYTDGITEASNEAQELFGEERLIDALRRHHDRSPKEICQLILEEVQVHSKVGAYSDDKTVVVVKRRK